MTSNLSKPTAASASPSQQQSHPAYGPPRDLIGYGRNPPDPQWPNHARLALSFVLNYEEGGESTILNGDAQSETYLLETPGGQARQGARNLNAESMYEYGSRAGVWRLLNLFVRAGIRGTVYGVGKALEAHPAVTQAYLDAGWEVASHGWRWIDYHAVPEEAERAHIRACIALGVAQTGRAPTGFYVGRLSPRSHALIHELYKEGGHELLWIADSYADDLPYYQPVPSAADAPEAILMLPYSLDCNDFKFLTPNNWSSSENFYTYLRDAFDELYSEGEAGAPQMMSVGLHPRIIGKPGRVGALRRFLDYIEEKEGVWVATREQIARHWREVHPYRPKAPSVAQSG